MSFTRREICLLLPALLPVAGGLQAFAQDKSLPSGAFSFDKAPLHVANNNAQIRMMLRGKLATGEGIEVHQTTLPPGGAPTATTHHHSHSEMWLIREGTIELTV
jgi:mannose-6-phosphate isomerase-like protein (cupin superfamily)